MRTIWKYPLRESVTELEFPAGSKVVHVGVQGSDICIWVEQSPDLTDGLFKRTFYIVGTGHPIPTGHAHMDHMGTVMQSPFVWHIYMGW